MWELSAFAAMGRTLYEQSRTVRGERYDANYAGGSLSAGLALNKMLLMWPGTALIPFASYEFTRLDVDGYHEGDAGLFGLEVGPSRADLHRVEAGTSFVMSLTKNRSPQHQRPYYIGLAEARLFYSGLRGDRQAEADVRLTRDPSAYTLTSKSWEQDKHSLGLGLNVNLDMGERTNFSGAYTFTGGPKIKSHQAELTFSFSF